MYLILALIYSIVTNFGIIEIIYILICLVLNIFSREIHYRKQLIYSLENITIDLMIFIVASAITVVLTTSNYYFANENKYDFLIIPFEESFLEIAVIILVLFALSYPLLYYLKAARVKVVITNDQKKVKVPTGIRLLIRRCCHAVLELENFEGSAEVSVRFVDNEEIRRLNAEYRNIDRETDVLSFPLGENGVYDVNLDTGAKLLGDIVISMEKAMEQAELYNHPLQREIGFLTVHSMLHLLGYDHENGGIEAVHMREKEETVLTQIGWKRDNSYYMGDEE